MRKEVFFSCKLLDHAYEQRNPSDFKEISRDPIARVI